MNLSCPHCGATIEFDAALAGQSVRCPECQEAVPMAVPAPRRIRATGPDPLAGIVDPRPVMAGEPQGDDVILAMAKCCRWVRIAGLIAVYAGVARLVLGLWSAVPVVRIVGAWLILSGLVIYALAGFAGLAIHLVNRMSGP